MLYRGIYDVVYSTIIIGMFRYIIIIIYEVPTTQQGFRWRRLMRTLGTKLVGLDLIFSAPLRKREYSKKIIGKLKYTRKRLYMMQQQQLAEPF